MYKITILFLLFLTFTNCKEKIKVKELSKAKKEQPITKHSKLNISKFISKDYEIQYETIGDLNFDTLPDKVVVTKKKNDSLSKRKMYIFFQKPDTSLALYATSKTILPPEYNTSSLFKTYYQEEINVNKGLLKIKLFGTGINGNLFTTFKFDNTSFLIEKIETYAVGAGSHNNSIYKPLEGTLCTSIINTMEENIPTKTNTFKQEKRKYTFKKDKPDLIMNQLLNKISNY